MTTATVSAPATTWNIDASHSAVEFSAKHMMITTVRGRIADVRGTITLNEANPDQSSVEVELGAASIDTRSEQRDGHLRSADFLDVDNFETITFRSTGVVPRGGSRFVLVGDLTIRGVTQEISLEAELVGKGTDPWGGQRAGFAATTAINRKEFGLTWNQALEAGGVLVSDQVKIGLEIQATLQAS